MLGEKEIGYMEQCAALITEQETEENCTKLKMILQNLGNMPLGQILKVPGQFKCSVEEKKLNVLASDAGAKFGRDKVLNVVPAALAIKNRNGKFFEIITDAYPVIICLYKGAGMYIDSPLVCAIDERTPALVSTVLSNIHFLGHAFNEPTSHKAHLEYCIGLAKKTYTNATPESPEMEVLRMLNNVLVLKIPLINAMKQNNSKNMVTTLCSVNFTQHAINHPEEHKVLIADCIKCAEKYCNNPNSIIAIIKKAESYASGY